VPFSYLAEDASAGGPPSRAVILRGTIDCLIQRDDGSVVVLEFKTGRPRPGHRRQLDLYVDAARNLFRGAAVEGRLIYAGDSPDAQAGR
jgi:ATP-dependent exoDNAse (exonuclease V) beta subunit